MARRRRAVRRRSRERELVRQQLIEEGRRHEEKFLKTLIFDLLSIYRFDLRLKYQKKSKYLSFIASFRFILPARYREEFRGDIEEIYNTLREEGHPKLWIYFFLSLNLSTVVWTSIRFKYSEYFEKARSVQKSE